MKYQTNKKIAPIKEFAKKSLLLRNAFRNYTQRLNQPSWEEILTDDREIWVPALSKSAKEQKILIATSVGSNLAGTILESALSIALTLRNAEVGVLLCDSALPACFACWIGWFNDQKQFSSSGPQKKLCRSCFEPAHKMFKSLGLPIHLYSEFISSDEINQADRISSETPFDQIRGYTMNGIAVGEHALAGTLRFYACGELNGEPYSDGILRRYFKASLLTTYAVINLLKKHGYECAVFNHGIYVPYGLVGEVCRGKGLRVVNWNPGYKKKTFVFSHNDTYHRTMIHEPADNWMNIEWDDSMESRLADYLKSRWQGTNDWIWFHEKPEFEIKKIIEETGIDFSKPCIGLLTSVMWDARLHYPSNAFPDMLDWIIRTIDYFIKRPDLQLVIRIHPAEVRGTLPSRQKVLDQINKVYSKIPQNVIIVPPESRMSTYKLMTHCDTVIIYNTKTGVELAAMGIPVIVAGEAWIRNKGFAMDAADPESYFKLLDTLPLNKRMPDYDILKAKKYAYHFFFRRMIPLDFMMPTGTNPPFKIELSDLDELMPGKNAGLDVICDGILKGTDFIHHPETDTN